MYLEENVQPTKFFIRTGVKASNLGVMSRNSLTGLEKSLLP
jgi:hypothetical protein